ncbi:MAG: hypothetical protein M1823_007486, partial [Watsoniomyces obsoletus]
MDEFKEKSTGGGKLEEDTKPVDGKEPEGSFTDYWRIFRYADRLDWALYGIAALGSIASGATLPLSTLIFGQFTTKFNNFSTGQSSPDQFRSDVDKQVLWFIWLFIARFVITYISSIAVTIAAIRTTRSIRKVFLESTLRQE